MGTARTYDNLTDDELTAAKSSVDDFITYNGQSAKGTVVENTRTGKRILAEQRANYDKVVNKRVTDKVTARTNELYKTKGAGTSVAQAVTSAPESTDAAVVERAADVELGGTKAGTPASRRRGRFRGGSGSISI